MFYIEAKTGESDQDNEIQYRAISRRYHILQLIIVSLRLGG